MRRLVPAILMATASLLACLATSTAQPAAEPKTLMTERGKLLVTADFNQPPGKDWMQKKGTWQVVSGALRAAELKSDQHAAVMRHPLPAQNFVIQYAFKLDGVRVTTLSINAPKGHICRVLLRPTGFVVQKDKDKKKPDSKAVVLDTCDTPIQPGTWHTLLVEIQGKEIVASLDGKHVAFGAHDGIDVKRANFGLTVGGESVSFKDLRVWEALPHKNWEATRARLLAARAKAKTP
ncbi:MAG TPA: hypothetical protein VEL76_31230 [Gemmataceae bacterium]|nr:hypothetical protein [Gemmataceae bacterium]